MPSFSVYLSVCHVATSCVARAGTAAPARGCLVAEAKPGPDRGAAAPGRGRARRAAATAHSVWLGIAPLTPRWLADYADHVWSRLAKRRT